MGISNTKLCIQYTFTTAIGYSTRGESIINVFVVYKDEHRAYEKG